jgi:hypothetical protein
MIGEKIVMDPTVCPKNGARFSDYVKAWFTATIYVLWGW